jgi:hypothetical protein
MRPKAGHAGVILMAAALWFMAFDQASQHGVMICCPPSVMRLSERWLMNPRAKFLPAIAILIYSSVA